MTTKKIIDMLRPRGNYTKTDMSHYTQLTAGRISLALLHKTPDILLPIFNLIVDKDSSVGSESEKRINTIENRFYTHKLEDKYNESIEEIILASLDAVLYGVSIVELYLDSSNDFAFRRIEKENIFYEKGKILLSSNGKKFEPIEPRYFIFRHKPVLLKLLWISYAKHFVLSHFLKFTEFLGVPPLVVNSSSSDAETMEAIAMAVGKIKSADVAVLGQDDVLKVLEGRGSQDDFLAFVKYCDSEIAKVINGSTLTSNAGDSGSLAMARIHEKQRLEIVAKDIKFAQRCVNRTFATLEMGVDLTIFYEEDKDLKVRAETLKILHDMGFGMDEADISKEFDLKLTKTKPIVPNRRLAPNARASALPLDKFDKFQASESFNAILTKNEKSISDEIEHMLLGCDSFESAFETILKKYPDMDTSHLEDIFATVLFNADLAGLIDEGE